MLPINPLGGAAGDLAGEVWQAAMFGLWNAGVWLLTVVLQLEDALLTPDLRADGPSAAAYRLTFWAALVLAVIMVLLQLLVSLLRRDARSLGAALVGCGKFVVVWAGWLVWCTTVVWAVGGLTRAVMINLLHVQRWQDFTIVPQFDLGESVEESVQVAAATVLGLLGLVLWLAALGHVFVMVARSVALLVLAATTPITAAGLVGEVGRGWFWKSVRWFHAAALTPLLVVLMLGLGAQTTAGVGDGLADGPVKAIGSAVPGVLIMLTSCLAPVVLFRLLAFVDPTTPAGDALRHTLGTVLQTALMLRGLGNGGSDNIADTGADPSDHSSDSGQTAGGGTPGGRQDQAEQSLAASSRPPDLAPATENPASSGSASGRPGSDLPTSAVSPTDGVPSGSDSTHGGPAETSTPDLSTSTTSSGPASAGPTAALPAPPAGAGPTSPTETPGKQSAAREEQPDGSGAGGRSGTGPAFGRGATGGQATAGEAAAVPIVPV